MVAVWGTHFPVKDKEVLISLRSLYGRVWMGHENLVSPGSRLAIDQGVEIVRNSGPGLQ
jgi:hypothetical protein